MFRRQKASKKLSADELKSKLYAHFDKSGSLNQLRTQLRSQLASELFKIAPPNNELNDSTVHNFDKTLLPLQVCHWLINDHLFRQGYQYTLSTFVSETNMPYLEKLLTAGDILGLFGLDSSTAEYKKISAMYINKDAKGCLNSLLLAIIKSLLDLSNKENEKDHKQKTEGEVAISSFLNSSDHEHILSTKKLDVENESSKPYYNDIPEPHKLNLQEQIQFIKEEKNREIKNLRHKLLEELERLHSQERCMHQELEQEKKEMRKDRDLLVNEKEQIKEKETLFIKEQENKFEKKAREIEESYATKLHSKDKEMEFLHKKIEDREKKLGQMEYGLSSQQEKYESLKRELNDVNQMYKSVHEKYNSLLDENTNLVRKFENMSDYSIIKEELSVKSKEIISLKQEIEKVRNNGEKERKAYTETVTELRLKSSEPKLHQMQRELNQTRDTLHVEEAMWSKEKTKLEKDSLASKELYKTVLQRIEEQKQDIQDLHQTIHILHYQLTNKDINYTAKSEPLFTKTIPKVVSFSANENIGKSYKNNPIYLSQKYRENALNITSDCKNRLRKLQQEIDQNYDKYSLIYCPSHDNKIPNTKIPSKDNTSLFAYNMRLDPPLESKNLANKSFDLFSGSSKHLMPSLKNFAPSIDVHKKGLETGISNKRTEKSLLLNSDIPVYSFLTQTKSHSSDYTNEENFLKFKNSSSQFIPSHFLEEHQLFPVTNTDNRLSLEKTSTLALQGHRIEPNEHEIEETVSNKTHEMTSPHISLKTYTLDSNSRTKKKVLDNFSSNIFNASAANESSSTQKNEFSNEDSSVHKNQTKPSNTGSFVIEPSHDKTNEISTLNAENNKELERESSNFQAVLSPEAKQSSVAINSKNLLMDSVKPLENSIAETTPFVDLDAAWNRKTSLTSASLPALQNSLLKVQNAENKGIFSKDESISSKVIVEASENSPIKKFSDLNKGHTVLVPRTIMPENSNVNMVELSSISHMHKDYHISSISQATDTEINVESGNSDTSKNRTVLSPNAIPENSNVKAAELFPFSQVHEDNNISSEPLDTDTPINIEAAGHANISPHHLKSILEIKSDTSGTDNEAKNDHNNDIKRIPEDSLSELSEVHMSCGSEQEEQKEESDNW